MGERQDHTEFIDATVSPHNQPALPAHARLELALQKLPQTWQTLLWYVDVMDVPPWRIGLLMGIHTDEVRSLIGRAHARFSEAYASSSNAPGPASNR